SACQAAIERAYSSIARFYDNCKKGIPGNIGYPKFKKNNRSVEYKTSGWKLSSSRKQITFTDKKGIGKLKLKGKWDLNFYQIEQIKRVRGSTNRKKAINKLGRVHLKISRQRQEHVKRVARCVIQSSNLVAYEDLRVKNLVKNHCLAKSINDAGWYEFRKWLEYFGLKFGRITVAVNPAYTSQECSNCGATVKKSLSTRTHSCKCGFVLDRDWNAAINILK
ncbi:transposase, partial [Planktothrix sp. FACHB-1355]|nr:transposase [Planktothrix sp. FACHB-1355]